MKKVGYYHNGLAGKGEVVEAASLAGYIVQCRNGQMLTVADKETFDVVVFDDAIADKVKAVYPEAKSDREVMAGALGRLVVPEKVEVPAAEAEGFDAEPEKPKRGRKKEAE